MASRSSQLRQNDDENPFDSRVEGAFGAWVADTPGETQLAFYKELANKLAWVLGSAYGKPYSKKSSPVHLYSQRIVKAILRDHGYKI